VEDGRLLVTPGEPVAADRVVALPVLEGPRLPGVPRDAGGFIPTDPYGRVEGLADVYAAGDATTMDMEPLWWPPSKIAGYYLSRYIATLAAAEPPPAGGIRIEVDDLEPLLGSGR